MKILHIARLYAPHIGGVETHVAAINQQLLSSNQVTVVTEQFDQNQPLSEEINGVKVIRLPHHSVNKKRKTWQWIWSQRHIFLQANIVHVHDIFWWLLPILPLIEHKVFTTFHGWETQYPVRWQAKLHRWLCAQFSVGTIHVGDWIKEFYWDKPNFVTYGGVSPSDLVLKPTKWDRSLEIVFLGRLSPENEVVMYCQLLTQLRELGIKHSIVWVGDGELRGVCEEYGTVTGFTDPLPYLSKAGIVFANSYLSILQAQSLGKVVVSLYSHALKQRYLETFPGSSEMVIASNPEDAVEKIRKFIEDPSKIDTQSSSTRRFARTQNWEKVADLYQRLWKKI